MKCVDNWLHISIIVTYFITFERRIMLLQTKIRAAVSVIAIAGLTGCMIGSDYHSPDIKTLLTFHNSEVVKNRTAETPAPDLSTWWTGFNDALLNSYIDTALSQNLDLEQAVARVSQVRASVQGARAALLPSAQVNAQAARNRQSLEDPLGRVLNSTPGYDRDGELYDVNASASWDLDLFGGLRRNREAAQAEYQAAKASKTAIQLSVAAETADTYVLIRTFQARIKLTQKRIETQQKLVDLVQLQYSRGITPELRLSQAQGALSEVAASIPALENGLEVSMNALDVLLGTAPGTHREELAQDIAIPDAPAIDTADGPAELIRRRPDIIVAERKLAASNARIGAEMSEYYPKLSLLGLIGTSTTDSGNLFTNGAERALGVIGLRWRLFDFGRVDAAVESAKGKNAEAMASYRLSILRATADVENSFSSLVKKETQERKLAEGETAYGKARNSALSAYKSGALSLIEVLDADERLLRTQDARVQAKSDATRAAISSFKALGGGWNANAG